MKGAFKEGRLSREVVLCHQVVRRADLKRDPRYEDIDQSAAIDAYSLSFVRVDESGYLPHWYSSNHRYVAQRGFPYIAGSQGMQGFRTK
jgi:hypothetical protein